MKKMGYYQSRDVIWCITHVLVLKRVADSFDVELPDYVPFLAHFSTSLGGRSKKGKHDDSGRGHKDKKNKKNKKRKLRDGDSSDSSDKNKDTGKDRDPYGSDSGLRDSKSWRDLKKHHKMMKLIA